jgi:hypothetical protein
LSSNLPEWTKVQDTVVRQNQTPITDETIVYRVVKIQWENLITSLDNITSGDSTSDFNVRKETEFFFIL